MGFDVWVGRVFPNFSVVGVNSDQNSVLVKVFVITAVVPVYVLLCAPDVNVIGRVVTVEVELLVRVGVPCELLAVTVTASVPPTSALWTVYVDDAPTTVVPFLFHEYVRVGEGFPLTLVFAVRTSP